MTLKDEMCENLGRTAWMFRHAKKCALTRVRPVRPRTIVEDKYAGEVLRDGGEVFGVGAVVERAVLAVVAAPQHSLALVQTVSHCRPVYLHGGSEDHQLVPAQALLILWPSCQPTETSSTHLVNIQTNQRRHYSGV